MVNYEGTHLKYTIGEKSSSSFDGTPPHQLERWRVIMNENSRLSQTIFPYLSVVAASRNDDHGGDPLIRTQIFINSLAQQCKKHRLPAELIMVDWNPVSGRPGLAAVLDFPYEAAYFEARVITVPAFIHHRFKYADKLSFFQMIAKNVGIRRARGKFILATNIDIIFDIGINSQIN